MTSTHSLTSVKVRNIVSLNTDLIVDDVLFEGVGFDFKSFSINGTWIFRFPLHAESADKLMCERNIVPSISLPIPISRLVYWINKPVGYPLPIGGYKRTPGTPLANFEFGTFDTSELASELGFTLMTLHKRVPIPDLRTSIDRGSDLVCSSKQEEILRECVGYRMSLAVRDYFRDPCRLSPNIELVTIHADLSSHNILVDEQGRLTGLIDWSQVRLGYWQEDFVGLWMWGGDSFVNEVIASYRSQLSQSDWCFIRQVGIKALLDRLESGGGPGTSDFELNRGQFCARATELVSLTDRFAG